MDLIILDRDGVINHDSPQYIKSPREWTPLPGSLEAIVRLTHAGYRVLVASNQAGLAHELFDYDDLFAIHDKMLRSVAELGGRIDGVFFCPHSDAADCHCRKPRPGLLESIARRLQIELTGVPVVGDSWRDIQAARMAGAQPFLVRTGNGAGCETEQAETLRDTLVYDNLAAVASALLERPRA